MPRSSHADRAPIWLRRAALLVALSSVSCAYTVEDWWLDDAQAFCACEYPERPQSCVEDQMAVYEESDWWSCRDEAAPVARDEMKNWVREYTDACTQPSFDAPAPEDPLWFESCGG